MPPEPRVEGAVDAVFTVVQDEPLRLPLWLRHLGRDFRPEDVHVLALGDPPSAPDGSWATGRGPGGRYIDPALVW